MYIRLKFAYELKKKLNLFVKKTPPVLYILFMFLLLRKIEVFPCCAHRGARAENVIIIYTRAVLIQ